MELYAGIGGFAAAAGDRFEVVAAIEQSDVAASVYRANFAHPVLEKNIAGLSAADYAAFDADLWWMSPPCQPFTKRGLSQDANDPRTKSFLRLLAAIREVGPRAIALENVPELAGSTTHTALLAALRGYRIAERIMCPTELGIPNKRRRYYLIASKTELGEIEIKAPALRALRSFLSAEVDPALTLRDDTLAKYHHAMSILDPNAPDAIASCFTSAYGRSPAKSGSFLHTPDGRVRRFAPSELLALFGFPSAYVLPVALERAYALIGNSLNVHVVRAILGALR